MMEKQLNNKSGTGTDAFPYKISKTAVFFDNLITHGDYIVFALLFPTIFLHWVVTVWVVVYFGVTGRETVNSVFFVGGGIIVILCGIYFGRTMIRKMSVPSGWITRWLPLLVWPMVSLIASVCDVISGELGLSLITNLFAFFIVLAAIFVGGGAYIALCNFVCYSACILAFLFYQRRLKGLKPMPKPVRIILLTLILAGLAVVGYGHYKNFDHYNSSMVYDM